MQCTRPIRIRANLDPSVYPEGLLVPCGQCLACRIAKRSEWAMRCLHELDSYDGGLFVTLTYDDDHLPLGSEQYPTLCKADLQKFFKRLRRRLGDRRIRYFACGEYGDRTQRPHYHAIIFGMDCSEEDKQMVMDSWQLCDWDALMHAARIDPTANPFGLAEPDSIRYVAQYVDKKYSGGKADEEYVARGRQPVFKLSSLGIGRDFCDRHGDQLRSNGVINFRGVKHTIPRYYAERLGIPMDAMREQAEESEIAVVEHITGLSYTRDEWYRLAPASEVVRLEQAISGSKTQREKELQAYADMRNRRI